MPRRLLTLRKNVAHVADIRKKTVARRLGRAYGKRIKYSILPKTLGKFLAGLEKKPPNGGPTTEPNDQTRGMMENARGWSSLSGTSSATMVRMMPTIRIIMLLPVEKEAQVGGVEKG